MTWDIIPAIEHLKAWPIGERINWSAKAQKLGITGANRGQILKETAAKNGVDTVALDSRSVRRIPSKKSSFPGSDISIGCAASKEAIKAVWKEMIQ